MKLVVEKLRETALPRTGISTSLVYTNVLQK